jgi:arylsulfatase A-like enzyme
MAADRIAKQLEPGRAEGAGRPNILVFCIDQWQTHMQVPDEVEFPAMRRLEGRGVSFDRQYCTVPICTPSRAAMWTGVHAKHTGLWDNTNFAWIGELSSDIPTIGHLLRDQGYYTAFKGKWHLSAVPTREDALERYGFSDFQQWGEMFGAPLEGAMLDNTATFEAVDWLEHKAPTLDRPWLLVCSLVNPHDGDVPTDGSRPEGAPARSHDRHANDGAAARLVRAGVGHRHAGQLRRRLRAAAKASHDCQYLLLLH